MRSSDTAAACARFRGCSRGGMPEDAEGWTGRCYGSLGINEHLKAITVLDFNTGRSGSWWK